MEYRVKSKAELNLIVNTIDSFPRLKVLKETAFATVLDSEFRASVPQLFLKKDMIVALNIEHVTCVTIYHEPQKMKDHDAFYVAEVKYENAQGIDLNVLVPQETKFVLTKVRP